MNKALRLTLALGSALCAVSLAQSTYSGPKVELSYVHGYVGADRVQMEALIKRFNDTHPNVVVKGQGVAWGTTWAQLGPLVSAGRAPDVLAMTEDVIGNFMARRALAELTPAALGAAKINAGAFYKNLWAGGQYGGKVYGVPLSSSAMVMFYNKDLLKKAGVASVPKNREQFLAAARACTTDKAGRRPGEAGFDFANLDTYGAGVVLPWSGGTFGYEVLRSNGADLVDKDFNAAFNSPAAVEAVQFLVDLSSKYNVSPPQLTETSDVNTFKAGKSCFNFQGVWQLTGYKATQGLNFGIAPQPRLGSKQDAAWGATVHLVLPTQRASYSRDKRAAALEFVRWMAAPEQNLYWTTSGALPTQAAVARNAGYAANPMAQINDGLEALYVPSGFPWVAQVRGAWDAALEAAFLGKKSVKQALDDGVREANQQVAQARQSLGGR